MGLDARIESERGTPLRALPDPRNHVNWILSLARLEGTTCLQLIDPYGDTVFDEWQLPMLEGELNAAAPSLTEANLEVAKRDYLERAAAWPRGAVLEAQGSLDSLTVADLRRHLASLLELVAEARRLGAEHCVRFVGD